MSQGWSKLFSRINWMNRPSKSTSLGATNLNKGDYALDKIDDRVITLDTIKADKIEINGMVSDVDVNESNGVITITYKDGSTKKYDTNLEKIAINFSYDKDTQKMILTLPDGTKQYVDLSALITQYEFSNSSTIAFSVDSSGKVSASIKNGSITEAMLETGYLANIKVEVAKAEAAATQAQSSETSSDYNAKLSRSYAIGGSGIRDGEDTDNAMYYSQQAQASAESATSSKESASASANTATSKASEASTSATNAAKSESNAHTYAANASSYASSASTHASNASKSATSASSSASTASTKASEASNSASSASTYASNASTSAASAKNSADKAEEALSKMQDAQVTGVKGAKETIYRKGEVNLTAENIGAVAIGGDTADNIVSFTSADSKDVTAYTDVDVLSTGEKLKSILAKISTMFKNIRYLYKMLGSADISAIGDGTVTGGLSTLNSNLDTTNDNVENRSKGIEYKAIALDGAYTRQVTENADYFIIATANAKDEATSPIIRIYINNSLFRINSGGIGNSVTTFLSVSLNSGDSVKIEFESVVTNNAYNSYFIMQLKKNY